MITLASMTTTTTMVTTDQPPPRPPPLTMASWTRPSCHKKAAKTARPHSAFEGVKAEGMTAEAAAASRVEEEEEGKEWCGSGGRRWGGM